MANRKNKATQDASETVEQEDHTEEICNKVVDKISGTFDERFTRIEEAMVKMAAAVEAHTQPSKQKKRAAPQDSQPMDTRNKALRAKYNPKPTTHSASFNESDSGEVSDSPATSPNARSERPARQSTQPQQHAHARDALPETSFRPTRRNGKQQPTAALGADPNFAVNQWLINKALPPQQSFISDNQPMSIRDFAQDDDLNDQVQAIINNSAANITRGNVRPGRFPFKYIVRGEEMRRPSPTSLTMSEHLWAVFRMIRDESVPSEIKPFLLSHIEQVLEDTRDYEWEGAVRSWSNEVFTRVADGRLPEGWAATQEIRMLRLSIAQVNSAKLPKQKEYHQSRTGQQQQAQQGYQDNLRGGPPCVNYNSQRGCQYQSGHLVKGKKVTHICAFCLFNSAAARPHAEFYCRNKQRQGSQTHF